MLQQNDVPDAIRAFSTLPRPDYVDVAIAPTGPANRSPEQWARAVVGDAAGLPAQFVWRVVLGLRLKPLSSRDCVSGWRIAGRGETWIRLEAASWFITANVVVQVGDAQVSLATFIRYDHPIARLVWPPVALSHRRVVPLLLRHAVRRPDTER